MKKFKLNFSNLESAEVLSKQQLKNIMGGAALFPTTCKDACGPGSTAGCDSMSICVTTQNGCLGCIHD